MALFGAILGSTLGLAGALFGTICSLKTAGSDRERRFIWSQFWMWTIGVSLFVAVVLTSPAAWQPLWWSIYAILLPVGIVHGIARHHRIRRETIETV